MEREGNHGDGVKEERGRRRRERERFTGERFTVVRSANRIGKSNK